MSKPHPNKKADVAVTPPVAATADEQPDPRTLDQRRAAHAKSAVEHLLERHKPEVKDKKTIHKEPALKYSRHARKLPIRVMASGLGQALAFLAAKDYSPLLLQHLSHWISTGASDARQVRTQDTPTALLNRIINGTTERMRRDTAEVLAYLKWLNRFTEAENISTTGEDD